MFPIICSGCQHEITEAPKKTFLGFQKVTCPSCNKKMTLPIGSALIVVYAGVMIWMAVYIFDDIQAIQAGGNIPFLFGSLMLPSALFIFTISALIRNIKLKKQFSSRKSATEQR